MPPVPGPAGTSPRREEITIQHQEREDNNGPHGLCTDAGEESAAPPQVKAGLTVDCKSVAQHEPAAGSSLVLATYSHDRWPCHSELAATSRSV